MVGPTEKEEEIKRALKAYILRGREKLRLEDEAEAEKTRKKKELDEKKLKEESEFKATKEKLAETTKKHEQLQQDKIKVFEHLKKILNDSNKFTLGAEDLNRLYDIGLAVTCVSTTPSHQPIHPSSSASTTIVARPSAVSANNQFKTSTSSSLPIQAIPHQKRNRSPSPIYRTNYNYKQAAGPHAFQKLEDSHRNHDYNRSYLFKPGSASQPVTYGAFYSPGQNVAYTMPSAVHTNSSVYSAYGSNRESVEVLHKTQPQNIPSIPPPPSPSQHAAMYTSHRSSLPAGTSASVSSNHVYHSKGGQTYGEDKYYMVRPTTHVPVHGGVIPIQQAPQSNKHGSITSGYPVRPVATQIGGPQSQMHIQQHNSGHHGSQSSHHSSQSGLHPASSHHSSLSSHHSSQSHQPQSHIQSNVHHQPSSGHYQPSHHSQSHQGTPPSQPSTVSVSLSQQSHHPGSHHQQHIQQLHVQAHHPSHPQSSSHHQLIQHHASPSIHHTSSQQHMQQIHHQPHSQSMHHSQLPQPHIQQHISSHQQSSQSQPTSVVTSQAYASQISAIQGGSRVVYSQSNVPH